MAALTSGNRVNRARSGPERTPLIKLAEKHGCTTIYRRDMMNGQVSTMVDFFDHPARG